MKNTRVTAAHLICLCGIFIAASGSVARGNLPGDQHVTENPIYKPLIDRGMEVIEFSVPVKNRKVTAIIASPPKAELAAEPALLLTVGGPTTHFVPPNDQPANYFWRHGQRVVSFTVGSMPGDLNLLRK